MYTASCAIVRGVHYMYCMLCLSTWSTSHALPVMPQYVEYTSCTACYASVRGVLPGPGGVGGDQGPATLGPGVQGGRCRQRLAVEVRQLPVSRGPRHPPHTCQRLQAHTDILRTQGKANASEAVLLWRIQIYYVLEVRLVLVRQCKCGSYRYTTS